jgi:hypothetical protein
MTFTKNPGKTLMDPTQVSIIGNYGSSEVFNKICVVRRIFLFCEDNVYINEKVK